MVIGAAGELPKPPSQPVVFMEGAIWSLLFPIQLFLRSLVRRHGG